MKYILQIHTGSWHDKPDEPERIVRKIEEVSSRIPVGKVIIGWSTDPLVYKKVGEYLHGSGIEMILWLPVFSETNKLLETDEALDVFGKRIFTPVEQVGESFTFGCFTSRHNTRNAIFFRLRV